MNAMAADNPKPVHHRRAHAAAKTSAGAGGTSGSGATAGTQGSSASTAQSSGAPAHKKVHHHYSSEGSTAIYNAPGSHNRSWALKQGRMVTVANQFLKNGVQKVNVSLQQANMNSTTQDKTIKLVFTPKMDDFNPQSNSSSSR
jgi:hypothetical protein